MSDNLRRTGVTAVALLVHWGLLQLTLPGLDADTIVRITTQRELFSVGVLGLVPWVAGAVLVEVIFLARPSLRPHRLGGREGRARMRRWWRVAWVVAASIQAWAMVLGMERMTVGWDSVVVQPGLSSRLVLVLTMVAGSGVIGWVWLWASERGWGSGLSTGLLMGAALQLWPSLQLARIEDVPPFELALLAVVAAVLVHRLPGRSVSWSVAGTLPLAQLAGVLALLSGPLRSVALAAFTVLLGMLLVWPVRVARLWGLPSERVWPQWARAVVANAAILLFTTWLSWDWLGPQALLSLFVVVAVGWDLLDEVRARRVGPLVAAWELHRVYAAEHALALLQEAGIAARLRGWHLRSLLHFFGPYVPIEVLVAPGSAERARQLLADHFAPYSSMQALPTQS